MRVKQEAKSKLYQSVSNMIYFCNIKSKRLFREMYMCAMSI